LPAGLQVNENALNSDSKIIGGSIVTPNQYPFVASFQRRALAGFSHSCGAIIYKPKWVITSAQCIDRFVLIHLKIIQLKYFILCGHSIVDVSLLRVVGGEFSFEDSTGYEQVRGVNRIIPYSRYNYETLEGDLALLEVIFN
jgi:Trypsin